MSEPDRAGKPILHVACLVFPTYQGTQAAIKAMLEASANQGSTTHLLCYAHAGYEVDAPYSVHRIGDRPRFRSLRSGPTPTKVALDVRCVWSIRRLVARLRPRVVLAHHIESAVAALCAGVRPVGYIAHTSIESELPSYLPDRIQWVASRVGRWSERAVCRRSDGVAAISPALSTMLDNATYLPVPWPRSATETTPKAQLEAKASLGIRGDAPVCLYAGNLDAYQGWQDAVCALGLLRRRLPDAHLILATESDPSIAQRLAHRYGVGEAVRFARLDGEVARRRVRAASDLCWVPRRLDGGLPIKMLDAFDRGLPVVATRRATAGLPLADACIITRDDDPEALCEAAIQLVKCSERRETLAKNALGYLSRHHSAACFARSLEAWVRQLQGSSSRVPRVASANFANCVGAPSDANSAARHHR